MEIEFNTNGNAKQKLCAQYWLNDTIKDIVYGGAKGGAKSYTGVSLIFGDALIYPGTHYFIARKKLNDLRKFTRPSIHEVFDHWNLSDKMYKYNGQDNVYEMYNKSKVFFIEAKYMPSDPDYARFGSMQMTRGWIEEAGEFEEAAKNNLNASLGRWKNEEYNLPLKLLQTCNPAKNYLYRDYYKKHQRGTLESHKVFIQALPQDNKMLDAGYLEHLEQSLNYNERQRLLMGKWEFDDDPNALTTFDAIDTMFDHPEPENFTGKWYITSDIAFESDKCIIILWNDLDVVSIFNHDKSKKPEEFIRKLQAKYGVANRHICYDATGAGMYLKNYLIGAYIFHSGAKPLKQKKGQPDYEHLKTQVYWYLAEAINNGKIRIHDKAMQEDITDECMQIKTINRDKMEDKVKMIKKDEIKKVIGRSPDILDALAMRFVYEIKGTFQSNI